jgi:hypothetical protein
MTERQKSKPIQIFSFDTSTILIALHFLLTKRTFREPKMTRLQNSLFSLLFLVFVSSQSWAKTNYNEPHPHSGVLKPYEAGPFDLTLDKKELDTLSSGKPVMKQPPPKDGELGGGAICVQDVEAPKEAVWAQILDLDSYKGKVPKLNDCKNYFVKKKEDGLFCIKTKMVVGILPGYSVSSHKKNYQACDKFCSNPFLRSNLDEPKVHFALQS